MISAPTEAFRAQFAAAAQQVQGSGWGILAFEPVSQRLLVLQAEKHQNLGVWGCVPLLVVDVWEHAYYLRYQNRRSGLSEGVHGSHRLGPGPGSGWRRR